MDKVIRVESPTFKIITNKDESKIIKSFDPSYKLVVKNETDTKIIKSIEPPLQVTSSADSTRVVKSVESNTVLSAKSITVNYSNHESLITESLQGAINGINKYFSTSFEYYPNTLQVFLNGLRLRSYGDDYVFSGPNGLQVLFPLYPGDYLEVTYIKR